MSTSNLFTFHKGIHPPDYKEAAKDKPITECSLPPEIIIPMRQHIGQPCSPTIKIGDKVKIGQKIGDAAGFISAPIHASISGSVKEIGPRPHFMGIDVESVVIVPDREQVWENLKGADEGEVSSPEKIREKVRGAGIVGMGGATFPTHVKLNPPKDKEIDSVIVNGCECEPFLTCDYRLMIEQPDDLVSGIIIAMRCVGARHGYIGIEVNKPDAIEILERRLIERENDIPSGMEIRVARLMTKYPQGSEKQLIKAIVDRTVPVQKLPSEVGVLVQNVGTMIAIYKAVKHGIPLIERVVTVTGPVIKEPKNLRVKIGTPISWLIDECSGFTEPPGKVICGGPMTGFAQAHLEASVIKGTSGIVALSKDMVKRTMERQLPCLKCGKCVDICPLFLTPSLFGSYVEKRRFNDLEDSGILNCVECGSCAYICPAKRPLIQLIRIAKREIVANKSKRKAVGV
ncbi:MAG: electron transport complex subunit RsxC [bacterium]